MQRNHSVAVNSIVVILKKLVLLLYYVEPSQVPSWFHVFNYQALQETIRHNCSSLFSLVSFFVNAKRYPVLDDSVLLFKRP